MQAWAFSFPDERPYLPLPVAGVPGFRCNPCAGFATKKLRQLCCPNSDHAKFFSNTQARESRRLHGKSMAQGVFGQAVPHLRQASRDPAQGPPELAMRLQGSIRGRKTLWNRGALAGATAMKLFTRWIMSAGLVLTATAPNAQVLAPYGVAGSHYTAVSDVGGPYAAMPEAAPGPGYGPRW